MLQDLRTVQCWPLWTRLAVTGVALAAAYLAQIPLERDWPGEPFLLFLLVVIATTLCFGTRIGLLSVALSTFLSLYFFEPVGSPTLRYSSDLEKIMVYALLALGCVGGFSYLIKAFIEKSDADKNKSALLRELTHRVANNFAAIAALIQMKSDSVSDTKAKSVLDDAVEQVKVMAGVHRRLRAGGQDVSLDSKAFIHELCDDLRASIARSRPISIECKADSLALCVDDAVSLGLIINELVTNATKHAFPDQRTGRIRVGFEVQNGQSCLSVEDDGVGFDDRRKVGIGEDLVRGLSRQLEGDLRVKSSKAGSTFRLSIPQLSPVTERPATTPGSCRPRFRETRDTRYRTALKSVRAHVKNAATKVRSNILVNGLCREVIEALPAAVYVTDAEGRITFYNEAAAALWGCRPELGDSRFCASWKLYRPDGTPLPRDECPMAMALRQKRPIRGMEAIAERPDGTRIPFIPYPTPLFDATGRLTGAVNMLVDISERRRAEEASQRLAAIVDSSEDAIIGKDLSGIVTSWNASAERLFGYTAQDMIGKSIRLLIPAHLQLEESNILKKLARGERVDHFETNRVRKDGSLVEVSLSVAPVRNAQGKVVGASKIARDITHRKRSEQALADVGVQRALAARAGLVGTYVHAIDDDNNDEKAQISAGYATIHGLPEGTTEITRSAWLARVHPEDAERLQVMRDQAFRQRQREYKVDYRIVRAGEVRWIESRTFISYSSDGYPQRVIGVNIDITERKRTEALLSESRDRLADAMVTGRVMAFEWDAITGVSRRSDNAANILGAEQVGRTSSRNDFVQRVHPDDRASFKTQIRQLRPDDATYALSFRYVRPDGRQVWLEETAKGEFDAAGRLLRIKGLTRDITERKIAELALAERNVQLALAGRAVLVGSYTYDVDNGTMQVSEGYAAIHGLPEGTTETSYGVWRARVHPEDLERAERIRDQAFADRRTEDNAEYRIVLSTGEVRWIERRGSISYGEDGRPLRVVGVNIDVTERKRAEVRQRVLNAELDHRVKNVLATVTAIITQTQEVFSSHADFVTALNHRVNSLARTHELLSNSNWCGASLAEIFRREFAPYTRGNTEVNGPSVTLKAEATQAVATVLHELTTNAAKHGALSNRSGRVSVQWRWGQNGSHDRLIIEWQETGGPPVLAPSRSGYGTSIIRELIPFELGGEVELSFALEGIRCRLEIPGEWTGGGRQRAEKREVLDSA